MYSSAYMWAKILGHMESRLSATVVSTYFDDAEVVELTDDHLILYTPSPFRRDIIERRYKDYVLDAMKELFNQEIELIVYGEEEYQSHQDKKDDNKPAFIAANPQFTFDTFVVGSSNRFAHSAAIAVSNNPAEAYNPLFIYGPSGLGKTHLLYAIAAQIYRNHPDYNIMYIKGDQFTNELIEALRQGKNFEFREKYRNADLFLVDDIQFIAGKDSTQEEFFHTFNNLFENHKQIVLTSDRSPSNMLKLEDRLKTRFEWGLIADIQPPDYETRMAIIKNKATALNLELSDDICSYIAENITTNVRQIEGTVKKIHAKWQLNNMTLDMAHVTRAIDDMFKGNADTVPTPALIISEVSRYYSIDESVLRGTLKNKGTATARQICVYLIRKLTNLSLSDIGQEFGRDHSTIIHSLNKVEKMLKEPNSELPAMLQDIEDNIDSRLKSSTY